MYLNAKEPPARARNIGEKMVSYRRRSNGMSAKGHVDIVEKAVRYRRNGIAVTPRKR